MVETNKISITLFCNQSIFCKIQSVTPQFTRSIMPNSLLTVLLEPKITFAVLLVFQFGGWPQNACLTYITNGNLCPSKLTKKFLHKLDIPLEWQLSILFPSKKKLLLLLIVAYIFDLGHLQIKQLMHSLLQLHNNQTS